MAQGRAGQQHIPAARQAAAQGEAAAQDEASAAQRSGRFAKAQRLVHARLTLPGKLVPGQSRGLETGAEQQLPGVQASAAAAPAAVPPRPFAGELSVADLDSSWTAMPAQSAEAPCGGPCLMPDRHLAHRIMTEAHLLLQGAISPQSIRQLGSSHRQRQRC